MTTKEELYSPEILEFCSHMRLISNVDRIRIIEALKEYGSCRVTQLAMEAGINHRQVYYHLSVLRKKDYIRTYYSRGRYVVYLGEGPRRTRELWDIVFPKRQKKVTELQETKFNHLNIVT